MCATLAAVCAGGAGTTAGAGGAGRAGTTAGAVGARAPPATVGAPLRATGAPVRAGTTMGRDAIADYSLRQDLNHQVLNFKCHGILQTKRTDSLASKWSGLPCVAAPGSKLIGPLCLNDGLLRLESEINLNP